MRSVLLFACTGLWVASAGCSSKSPGCVEDNECPSGNVCLERKCEKLCQDDNDCTAGRYCNGAICVVGTRSGTPVIASISGSGSSACVPSTGGNCVGTHFVVTVSNLGGSEFLLASADGGTDYVMTVPAGGRVQDDRVDLAPQGGGDIVAGDYVLVVSNSAGEDQAGVSLLKGEPGDDADLTGDVIVARINASTAVIDADNVTGGGGAMTGDQIVNAINDSGTSGIISSERVAGGSGGGSTLYEYDNSPTATETGHSGDRMVVRVDASTTGVVSQPVDPTRLEELCGDPDGCQISLGTIGWYYVVDGSSWKVPAPYVNAPCRFFLRQNAGAGSGDAWSISSSCTQQYVVCEGSVSPCASERLYIPHYSGQFGSDGFAGSGNPPDDTLNVIHNRACYFSEALPDTGLGCICDTTTSCDPDGASDCACDADCGCPCDTTGACDAGCVCDPYCIYTRLENDTSKGFTLFASHPSWSGPHFWVGDEFWPPGESDRACILIVED